MIEFIKINAKKEQEEQAFIFKQQIYELNTKIKAMEQCHDALKDFIDRELKVKDAIIEKL